MQTPPEPKSIAVALIYDDKEFGRRLRDMLIGSGVRVVCELCADRLKADTRVLAESGAEVVVVNLDPDLDAAIGRIMEMMDMDRQRLMINDAEASRSLDGWDQARWARHLIAKVLGCTDVDPPRPDHTEPIRVQVCGTQVESAMNSATQAGGPEEMDTGGTWVDSVTGLSNQDSWDLNVRMGAEIESMLAKESAAVSPAHGSETDSGTSGDLDQLLDKLAGHVANLDVTIPDEPVFDEARSSGTEPPLDDVSEAPILTPQSTPALGTNKLDARRVENLSDKPLVPEDAFSLEGKSDPSITPNRLSKQDRSEPDSIAVNMDTAPPETLRSGQTECLKPLAETSPWGGEGNSQDVVDSPCSAPDPLVIESDSGSYPDPENPGSSSHLSVTDNEEAVDHPNPGICAPSVSGVEGLELLPLESAAKVTLSHASCPESEPLVSHGLGVDQVIAIGASIGGPDVLRTILARLPTNLAAVLVVVQHMDDAFFSNYIKQLKDVGTLSVWRAENGGQVHHGEVLVVPPGQRLRLDRSGGVGLLPRTDEDDYSPSIDDTFSSLAITFGAKLHALILSGMARDALRGIQIIKENGGVVWTQSPETCVVSSMVDAAQEAGLASFSSEPETLARRLVEEIGVESRE